MNGQGAVSAHVGEAPLIGRLWSTARQSRLGLRYLPLACSGLLVVAVPLIVDPFSGTPRAFVIPKLTALHLLTALGLVGLLLDRAGLASGLARFRFPRHLVWLAALWLAWLGLTTALAAWPARSWIGSYDWQQGLFTQLGLVAVAALAFLVTRDASTGRTLHRAAIWGSLPVVAYGLVQFLHLDPVRWTQWGDAGRVFSTLGNENYFGAYLAMVLPLTLTGWFVFDKPLERAGQTLLIALQAFCLYATNSIGAVIAESVGCLLVLWWRWQFTVRSGRVALATALLLSMAATLVVAWQGDTVGSAVVSAVGREVRPFTWAMALRAAAARPLTGWGLSSFDLILADNASPGFRLYVMPLDRVMDRAHNLWLERAVETGWPGLVLWLALLASLGNGALRAAERQNHLAARQAILGGVAALFAYLVYQVVNPSDLGTVVTFWWLIGWTMGLGFPEDAHNLEAVRDDVSLTLSPATAQFLLQAQLLVAVFGTGYGVWQWFGGAG